MDNFKADNHKKVPRFIQGMRETNSDKKSSRKIKLKIYSAISNDSERSI
jgi:hypothetical protein